MSPRPRGGAVRLLSVIGVVAFALAIVALQVWAAIANTEQVARIVEQLEPVASGDLSTEKTRQEVISLRIQNELRGYFWSSLVNALGPMVAAFAALIGAWVGLRNYLGTREKERLDRAAGDLKDVLDHLVSDEARKRAVGVVGLQHFLTPDKKEYHLRVLSALITAARLEQDAEVIRSIRLAAAQAVATLPEAMLQQVSWQGVKLRGVSLRGRRLSQLDLRDAALEDADLSASDLSAAVMTNARLNGTNLERAKLQDANLAYVDFAGASLAAADLRRAVLHHAKVWGMDLAGADLRQAAFEPDEVPWELVRNWRQATYDDGLLARLIERYGPATSGPRVLMLMWEIPPLVAGGTWTACYHLVRQLRRRGADVTVIVPWDEASILPRPFGCEVEVVALGMTPPAAASSPYGDAWSPYASFGALPPWASPYGGTGWPSPYGSWGSPYGGHSSFGPYSGFGVYGAHAYGRVDLRHGTSVLRLGEELERRLLRHLRHESFDLIHAHDWVTFGAAAAAAKAAGKPWIAHFHSTEAERRPTAGDFLLERIEREGAQAATHIVVPGSGTKHRLEEGYGVAADKITVVPNPLSDELIPPAETGSFDSRRVVFLGRLTAQKGPDLFVRIAEATRRQLAAASFWGFGGGEEWSRVQSPAVYWRGALDWSERGRAFADAAACVVPSRAEPFGMVVLEAMQHGVPVLYPTSSGAAEVLAAHDESRKEKLSDKLLAIDPEATATTAATLVKVLSDRRLWSEVVGAQQVAIAEFLKRSDASQVVELWHRLVPSPAARVAPAEIRRR